MRILVGISFLTLASAAACSGATSPAGFALDGGASGTGNGGSGAGTGSGSGGVNLGGNVGDSGGGGTTVDGGFVCTPNPLNYDIPANGCDDDGDGKVDNQITCDTGAVASALQAAGSAADFAAAIELCQVADATHWGLVSAVYTDGHTSNTAGKYNFDQQHGVLPTFGNTIKPQDGAAFGVLSTGSATVLDSDFVGIGGGAKGSFKGDKNGMQNAPNSIPLGTSNSGDAPTGYPKATPAGCDDGNAPGINDVINVKLQIKVPANAKGVSFDFDFWSGEWPEWVCSDYNDSFIAYLTSKGFPGSPDNISFDSKGNPVSVNNGFFGVCTPGVQTGCSGGNTTATSVCGAGIGDLAGTGFADPGTYCTDPSSGGGATGWLTSSAPVQAGETITLEFMIWDKGDWNYDSSVLIDNFSWEPQAVSTPVTVTAPPPK
jgi:hypothetical protein